MLQKKLRHAVCLVKFPCCGALREGIDAVWFCGHKRAALSGQLICCSPSQKCLGPSTADMLQHPHFKNNVLRCADDKSAERICWLNDQQAGTCSNSC